MSKKGTDYLTYVEKMNSSPVFINLAKSLDYEVIGLQILDSEEEVVKEFTSYHKCGKILRVKEGLESPEFTVRIGEDVIRQLVSEREQAWMQKHPVEAALKYAWKIEMPLMVKLRLLKLLGHF